MARLLRLLLAAFALLVVGAVIVVLLLAHLGHGSRRAAGLPAAVDLDEIPAGADLDAPIGDGFPRLAWAARVGDTVAIRRLIAAGADPDARDSVNGWPPLLHAIHRGETAAAAALLDAGADPDVRAQGWTPLVMAATYGDARTVELLLDRGADPYLEGAANPLEAAAFGSADLDKPTAGQCQTEVVRVLRRRAPELAMPGGLGTRALYVWFYVHGCDEEARLLAASQGPQRP